MASGRKTGGRQAGTPNKLTLAMRERITDEADPIGFLVRVMNGEEIEAAPAKDSDVRAKLLPTLDQRMAAAVALARKLVPDAKERPLAVELPLIERSSDIVAALGIIVGKVAAGEILPSEGQALAAMLETQRRAIETEELERRIQDLEQGAEGDRR